MDTTEYPISVVRNISTIESFLVAGGASQTGTAGSMPRGMVTFQAIADGSSGAFAATIKIYGSLDNSNWVQLGYDLDLSGTAGTADTDGFTIDGVWTYCRADISGFSGTGATCSVYMSV